MGSLVPKKIELRRVMWDHLCLDCTEKGISDPSFDGQRSPEQNWQLSLLESSAVVIGDDSS